LEQLRRKDEVEENVEESSKNVSNVEDSDSGHFESVRAVTPVVVQRVRKRTLIDLNYYFFYGYL